MIDELRFAGTLGTALGCGLVGGIFFGFSSFVMRALDRLTPANGIAAMQSINVVVLNPWFLVPFMGTAVGCVILGTSSLLHWRQPGHLLVIAGSALYLIGTLGVTIVFNVPRNDALAAVDASSSDGAAVWARYVNEWTDWNTVRTATALAAGALLIVALLLGYGQDGA